MLRPARARHYKGKGDGGVVLAVRQHFVHANEVTPGGGDEETPYADAPSRTRQAL